MSTRSNIIVEDKHQRIQLYRHSDGYPNGPHGVVHDLVEALEYAWESPRFEADDFAAAIVRAWKEEPGNIYIDGSPVSWEMIHGDTEWVYVIRDFRVKVYDWHLYWLDKDDPDTTPPVPIWEGRIGEKYPDTE